MRGSKLGAMMVMEQREMGMLHVHQHFKTQKRPPSHVVSQQSYSRRSAARKCDSVSYFVDGTGNVRIDFDASPMANS